MADGLLFHPDCYLNLHGLRLAKPSSALLIRNIDLSFANLKYAIFHRVIFDKANLNSADLSHAELTEVLFFNDIDCRHADFRGAYLYKLILRCSAHFIDLEGADFSGAFFFSKDIATQDGLRSVLRDLPPPYFGLDKADRGNFLNIQNHLILKPFILADLIRTISNYSDEDFLTFTRSLEYHINNSVDHTCGLTLALPTNLLEEYLP